MKFTETVHCKSRAHCGTCLTSTKFRKSMKATHDGWGRCPLSPAEKEEVRKAYDAKKAEEKPACWSCAKRRAQN